MTKATVTKRSLLARGVALLGTPLGWGVSGCDLRWGAPPQSAVTQPARLETWHVLPPGPALDVFQTVLNEYAAAHPGITFQPTQLEVRSASALSEYQQKITAAITSGTPPEILHVNNAVGFGDAGMLVPLDDYVKRDKAFGLGDIFESMRGQGTFFDRAWGVPQVCDTRALWINKALLRAGGLDPNKPPRTWDDLEQAAVRLTRKSSTAAGPERSAAAGAESGYELVGYIPLFGNIELYSYIHMNGGEIMRLSGTDKVELLFNKPEAVAAAEFVVRLYDRLGGYDAVVAHQQRTFQGRPQDVFFRGQVAMMRHGSWAVADVKQLQQPPEYGLAPEPYGHSAKGPVTLVGGWKWALARGGRSPDQGWAFISWFSQAAQAVRIAAPSGTIPVRKSAANADYVQKNPDIKFFFEALNYAKPFPAAPWEGVMSNSVNGVAQAAIVQKKATPRQALDEAARTVQTEIDKWRQRQGGKP